MKLPWLKSKILPELVGLPLMKGHKIKILEKDNLYPDTLFSTCVIDKSDPPRFAVNSIAYSNKLEHLGWLGAADTIRADVKRGEFGGSFEEKSFFRNPQNEEFEIALTSEYDSTNACGVFVFEAYRVTHSK